MKARLIIAVLAFVVGQLVLSGSAIAQNVVKRVKCADVHTQINAMRVYRNTSNTTRVVSYQVVKDGCRPKALDGFHRIRVNGTQGSDRVLTRHSRYTEVIDVPVANNGTADIYFDTFSSDERVRGTFDYIINID